MNKDQTMLIAGAIIVAASIIGLSMGLAARVDVASVPGLAGCVAGGLMLIGAIANLFRNRGMRWEEALGLWEDGRGVSVPGDEEG